jgi:hypothetical protein
MALSVAPADNPFQPVIVRGVAAVIEPHRQSFGMS